MFLEQSKSLRCLPLSYRPPWWGERYRAHVTSTKPLVLSGQVVPGLRVQFDHGRVVGVAADRNAELVTTLIQTDDGAARLGEVALVDGASRIGRLGTVFYETLLDENSASHLALGAAYPDTVTGAGSRERMNHSSIHVDFTIGSDDITVTGISREGTRVPLLRGGAWQFAGPGAGPAGSRRGGYG